MLGEQLPFWETGLKNKSQSKEIVARNVIIEYKDFDCEK
jgi:hypothetical protein